MPTDVLAVIAVAGWVMAIIGYLLWQIAEKELTRSIGKSLEAAHAPKDVREMGVALIEEVQRRRPSNDGLSQVARDVVAMLDAGARLNASVPNRAPDLSPDMEHPVWVGRCRGCGMGTRWVEDRYDRVVQSGRSSSLLAQIGQMVEMGLIVDRVSDPAPLGKCRCEGGGAS